MSAKGAKYKWKDGKILHASYLWHSPSKRRIPRILIEDRAMEVGILLSVDEQWFVFEETTKDAGSLPTKNATLLQFYLGRYHVLPEKINGVDSFEFLKMGHTLLLWGKENRYYIHPID